MKTSPLAGKLMEHKHYMHKHGEDLPGIRSWKWMGPGSNNASPKSFGKRTRKQGTNE